MKLIVYGTIGGTTRRVAARLARCLEFASTVAAVDAAPILRAERPRFLVLACPTYGDAELEPSFEDMLLGVDWSHLAGTAYGFCEVGIYTGYEDFGHGLSPQVHGVLQPAGLRRVISDLSLDALPISDWQMVDDWGASLRARLMLGP